MGDEGSDDGLPITLAEWPRGGDVVRVRIERREARAVVDVRVWWRGRDGALNPTRTGVMLPIGRIEDLAAALSRGVAIARVRGLIDEPNPGRDRFDVERESAP